MSCWKKSKGRRHDSTNMVGLEARAPAWREGGVKVEVEVAARNDSASRREWLPSTLSLSFSSTLDTILAAQIFAFTLVQ